ncbi:hypothetical protein SAY87_006448 [Trapa incisa]|uniref:RRM domain-containing protein n=1 Tax=Trapa incisa TaxID=236973 RepID=A0AAN7JXZ9_9MYRT|nr:hypothetical protein SAY87_006448 [Trapa incisa]
MAFFSKVGSILKQTARRQSNLEISSSNPFLYQVMRCMSSSKLFVGGLSFNTDQQGLMESFSKYGEVVEARVIMDRETGRSRGFGFITYTSSEEASSAIQALDGQDLHGRQIRVNYAADRQPRYGGGGYMGGNYGSPGGGYGGSNYGGGGSYNSPVGGDRYGSGGGYGSGNMGYGGGGYGGGAGGGYNSPAGDSLGGAFDSGSIDGSYGVAGGGGGRDSFSDVGDGSNVGASEGNNFGQAAADEFALDDPAEGNFRGNNQDHEDDYAKRA